LVRQRALAAGREAEVRVAAHLEALGFRVLERNWRGGGGELDIVALRDGALRFVEVKLRDPDDPLADEAVPAHKRTRLRGAARAWLTTHEMYADDMAFMVVWIAPDGSMRLVDDAFDG
jgi:putative endonuclease